MAKGSKSNKTKAQKTKPKAKKISPPVSVTIGPFEYSIIYGPIEEGKNWGNVSANKQTIWIDNSGTAMKTSVVLLHEILHALVEEYDALAGKETEEMAVNLLSVTLITMFRVNPKVTKFIMGGIVDG